MQDYLFLLTNLYLTEHEIISFAMQDYLFLCTRLSLPKHEIISLSMQDYPFLHTKLDQQHKIISLLTYKFSTQDYYYLSTLSLS